MFNHNYIYIFIFIFAYLIFTYLINFFWLNIKITKDGNIINKIPYPILLNYWKKRISTTLQFGNVAIISEAYRRLFNFGAETLQHDFDLEHAFD